MSAPASALTGGPGLAASEGAKVALAPGHERPLGHVFGAVQRSQPRPARAGQMAGKATPKVDPKQSVVPGLDLSIAKSHIGPFEQGQHNATYMITVSNMGSVPVGGLFKVTDYLPGSMTATSMSGIGWDCTLATLTCARPDVLLPATQFPTIYLTVDVADDAPELATNTATLTADFLDGSVTTTATDPTRILSGDEDRGSGKGGVNVKIDNHNDNHNDSTAVNLNLNHTSAHAHAHQGQGQLQAQAAHALAHQGQAQLQAQATHVATKVHTHVNTKFHVHTTAVAVAKSGRHHHHDR